MGTPIDTVASGRERRRLLGWALLRSLGTTTVLVAIYYLAPFNGGISTRPVVQLAVALGIIAALMAWQLRAIVGAPYPALRAVEGLCVVIPLLLISYAVTYFLMANSSTGNFTQPLDRTGALYFTVTIFGTVGFGDIAAVTQSARLVVTSQMLVDLLLFGLGLRVFTGAIRRGQQRQPRDQ